MPKPVPPGTPCVDCHEAPRATGSYCQPCRKIRTKKSAENNPKRVQVPTSAVDLQFLKTYAPKFKRQSVSRPWLAELKLDPEHEFLRNLLPWTVSGYGYVVARARLGKGLVCQLYLHKVICPSGPGFVTDHINRNKLDNRVSNLRVLSFDENKQNVSRTSKTGYLGVIHARKEGFFIAQGSVNGKPKYLGTFESVEKAYEVASAWRKEHLPHYVGDINGEEA